MTKDQCRRLFAAMEQEIAPPTAKVIPFPVPPIDWEGEAAKNAVARARLDAIVSEQR